MGLLLKTSTSSNVHFVLNAKIVTEKDHQKCRKGKPSGTGIKRASNGMNRVVRTLTFTTTTQRLFRHVEYPNFPELLVL